MPVPVSQSWAPMVRLDAATMTTLAKRVVHIDSTSSTFAALMRVWSLSACWLGERQRGELERAFATYGDVNIVIRKNQSGIGCCKLGVRHRVDLVYAS